MKPISKPLLPPKRGYVEREDAQGNRYYYLVDTIAKVEVFDTSRKFVVPEAKDQLFEIIVVGGGGGFNSMNGDGGDGHIVSHAIILNRNENIDISIGAGGSVNKSGGTTSFGTYLQAIGGSSCNGDGSGGYEYDGASYGTGGTENEDAKDGVCIIKYQAPLYT